MQANGIKPLDVLKTGNGKHEFYFHTETLMKVNCEGFDYSPIWSLSELIKVLIYSEVTY